MKESRDKMPERVVVAMSGGVDSSVAAALLKDQGYDVVGLTICFNFTEPGTGKPRCCSLESVEDARNVAFKLGIKHYVINMQEDLEKYVIKDFIDEYSSGRTPNPCVICNEHIKFGRLLKKAVELDAKYIATGHYASINKTKNGEFVLGKAKDTKKDQTYFLYRLNQEQLGRILFPLGNYTKDQVRELAGKYGLHVVGKSESQEICFIKGRDYKDFLKTRVSKKIKPGNFVDSQNKIIGRHNGIPFYTIGQRDGLGIAMGYPVYIKEINKKRNVIVVGKKEEVFSDRFILKNSFFTAKVDLKRFHPIVRIRYNHKGVKAKIKKVGKDLQVYMEEKQFAVTPGQSAVFYENDMVFGGGIIDKVI